MAQVAIKFRGDDEGARVTAESVAKSLDKLGLSAGSVKFDVATKGGDGLYQSLRGLKGEATQHERVFGFFGKQLAETGLVAQGTATSMIGLGVALATPGMAMVAAAEAVKLVVEMFRDFNAEGKKLESLFSKWRQEDIARGATAASELARARVAARAAELDLAGNRAAAAEIRALGEMEQLHIKLNAAREKANQLKADALKLAPGTEKSVEAMREALKAEKDYQDLLAIRPEVQRKAQAEPREVDRKTVEAHSLFMLQKKAEQAQGELKIEADLAIEIERIRQHSADLGAARTAQELAAARRSAEEKIRLGRIEAAGKLTQGMYDPEKDAEIRGEEERERARHEALEDRIKQTHQLATAGGLAADAFGSLGEAIGGTAGKMTATLGKLIQQAIQLAIAMSATGGPFAWLNIAASAAAILATISSIPQFAAGTPYVPQTGLALVHQGERIIPARENALGFGGTINLTINAAALDRAWWHQQQRHILAEIRDAARNRRTG